MIIKVTGSYNDSTFTTVDFYEWTNHWLLQTNKNSRWFILNWWKSLHKINLLLLVYVSRIRAPKELYGIMQRPVDSFTQETKRLFKVQKRMDELCHFLWWSLWVICAEVVIGNGSQKRIKSTHRFKEVIKFSLNLEV